MALQCNYFLTCQCCGQKRELDRVYGHYSVFLNATPNNPINGTCTMDGFMPQRIELCGECGERVRMYIRDITVIISDAQKSN